MKAILWCIKRKIAQKSADTVVMTYSEAKRIKTPLLLRLLGLELLEVIFIHKNLTHNVIGKRLFIRRKKERLHLHKPISTWRVQGDDLEKAPMVLWERND